MINQPMPLPKMEGQNFEPIPPDIYHAQLTDISLKERPKYKNPNDNEYTLDFEFTLLEGEANGETLRGRKVWKNFVSTYLYIGKNGKNWLYKIVESLIGRELTQEEEATLDTEKMNKLIGRQCRVHVTNTNKNDKVYNNIESFLVSKAKFEPYTETKPVTDQPAQYDGPIPPATPEMVDETNGEIRLEDIPFA